MSEEGVELVQRSNADHRVEQLILDVLRYTLLW